MPTNVTLFEDDLRKFTEELLPQEFSAFIRKVALDLLVAIILKTPVDTGRARGNWRVAINETDRTTNVNLKDKQGTNTINRGSQKIMAGTQQTPYVEIVISNSLPYIVPLEFGHSKQAPNGMVTITVAKMAAKFREVLGKTVT